MSIRDLSERFEPLVLPEGHEAVELDLGCGTGLFTAALAERYPDRLVLAADTLSGRLRKVRQRADRRGLANLDVLRVEARHLVARLLPDASLDRIHLLCPDPWPKAKHKGHRLMASEFVARLHRVLRPDGIFHFSSDDGSYCDQVGEVIAASRLFAPAPEGIADVADIQSSFERRWLGLGKTVDHRSWRKLPLPPETIGH